MLNLIFFVFSLVLVTQVADFFASAGYSLDEEKREALLDTFGSVPIAMRTFTLASLTGGWGSPFTALESTGNPVDSLMFLLMTYFIQVALLNIILGIFVDDAMSRLQPDDLEKARQLDNAERDLEEQLIQLCKEVVADGSGIISLSEWQTCQRDGRLRYLLEMSGFRHEQVNEFFMMLLESDHTDRDFDGKEGVDVEVFVNGCLRLKGNASCFDINAVLYKLGAISEAMLEEVKLMKSMAYAGKSPKVASLRST
jgi:hypothetical protein